MQESFAKSVLDDYRKGKASIYTYIYICTLALAWVHGFRQVVIQSAAVCAYSLIKAHSSGQRKSLRLFVERERERENTVTLNFWLVYFLTRAHVYIVQYAIILLCCSFSCVTSSCQNIELANQNCLMLCFDMSALG